jgi:hypothetical protein
MTVRILIEGNKIIVRQEAGLSKDDEINECAFSRIATIEFQGAVCDSDCATKLVTCLRRARLEGSEVVSLTFSHAIISMESQYILADEVIHHPKLSVMDYTLPVPPSYETPNILGLFTKGDCSFAAIKKPWVLPVVFESPARERVAVAAQQQSGQSVVPVAKLHI